MTEKPEGKRAIIIRNAGGWAASLLAYCVMDYFYVRHGASTVAWAEPMFLPAFFLAMFWANKGLFRGTIDGTRRWFAVASVSFAIMVASGFVLIAVGVWFHFSIGGTS
jgi:uncharacterized membrane protein